MPADLDVENWLLVPNHNFSKTESAKE